MSNNKLKNTIVACTLAGIITVGGTASEAALGDRTLSQGMRHNDVKELQQELKKRNFFTYHTTTTYFGNITRQAVMKFQKANGLKADGYFGPASVRALNNTTTPAAQPKAPAPAKAATSTVSFSRTLRNGSRGNDVKSLQAELKKLGHHKGSVDGIFGSGTRSSVISFQRAQNIAADGIAGSGTFRALNNVLSGKVTAGKPSTTPSRNSSSKSTSINIINEAKKHLGSRYVFGGSSPSGFDCSGFTQYVYKQMGINIPRSTSTQANAGSRLSKSQLQAGDLLIFSNTYKAGPSHAGIYIGNGQFIHAGNSRTGVLTSSINSGYYNSKFSYGRRVY